MRDIALTATEDAEGISYIDIDIVNGEPVYLDEASQTTDQRAAVAVYACKGTMPGQLDFGVSWSMVYSKEDTTIQLHNELQQQVQNYAGSSDTDAMLPQTQYSAQLLATDDGLGVIVQRG